MKSFTLFVSLLFFIIASSSCKNVGTEEAIQQAEEYVKAGNAELAAASCDILADTAQLSATQMCRLAIIYAHLSELTDDQNYMATATECYQRAVALDNDNTESIDQFVETLDPEHQGVVRLLNEVSQAMTSPCDYTQNTEGELEELEYVQSNASL